MKRSVMPALITLFLVAFSQTPASAVPINLNDFYSDGNVTISADGSSATMIEDPDYGVAYLSNDPFIEGNIFIPLNSISLTFMYEFNEPYDNDDEFYALLFYPYLYDTLQDRNGNYLEISVQNTSSGMVTWDLVGADFLGTTVGLQFELNFLSGDPFSSEDLSSNSSVSISNVRINTQSVPEPSTILLLAMGLLGLPLIRCVGKIYNRPMA